MNYQKPKERSPERMTLKEYLQLKNLKRNMEFKLLNFHQGVPNALSQEKQMQFQANVNAIKQYIRQIIGQGSLLNKFVVMLDNLYSLFKKQIFVYHKMRFQRQIQVQDNRFSQFRKANAKLNQYLKTCQQQDKQVQQRLKKIQKAKQQFQRQQALALKERMKKSAIEEQNMLKDIQAPKRTNKITLGQDLKTPSIPTKNIGKISNIFASIIGQDQNQNQKQSPVINIKPVQQKRTLKDSQESL